MLSNNNYEYIQLSWSEITTPLEDTLEISRLPTGWRKTIFEFLRKQMVRWCGVSIYQSCMVHREPKRTVIATQDIADVINNQVQKLVLTNQTPGFALVGYEALNELQTTTHFTKAKIISRVQQHWDTRLAIDEEVMAVMGYEIPVILTHEITGVIIVPQSGVDKEFKTKTFFHYLDTFIDGKRQRLSNYDSSDTRIILLRMMTEVLNLSPILHNRIIDLICQDTGSNPNQFYLKNSTAIDIE